ncbi:hypothetical protein EMCRGX_G030991 [Ephydatia muelleri]
MADEAPVTDVVIISSLNDCPPGYTAIKVTVHGNAHGHINSANLWEKVMGGQDGERYLCYTKEEKDGKILEDINIPSMDAMYVPKGFSVLKKTTDGKAALYHRDLIIKRTRKEEAKYAVVDIIVANVKDKVSEIYNRKLEKVNKNHILCRQIPYKYISPAAGSIPVATGSMATREDVDHPMPSLGMPKDSVILYSELQSTPQLEFAQQLPQLEFAQQLQSVPHFP